LGNPGEGARDDFPVDGVGDIDLRAGADQSQVLHIQLVVFAGRGESGFEIVAQEFADNLVDPRLPQFIGQLIEVGIPPLDEPFPGLGHQT